MSSGEGDQNGEARGYLCCEERQKAGGLGNIWSSWWDGSSHRLTIRNDLGVQTRERSCTWMDCPAPPKITGTKVSLPHISIYLSDSWESKFPEIIHHHQTLLPIQCCPIFLKHPNFSTKSYGIHRCHWQKSPFFPILLWAFPTLYSMLLSGSWGHTANSGSFSSEWDFFHIQHATMPGFGSPPCSHKNSTL